MKNRENLKELTELELEDKFRHFKEELFNLRFQVVTGQLTNTSRISLVKKNIARVQTQLNQAKKTQVQKLLKEEYAHMIEHKSIDPKKTPLRERVALLKTQLSGKALKVRREIQTQVDSKVAELMKAIKSKLSEKLKDLRGKKNEKEEADLRASTRRLSNSDLVVRKKFLDKLSAMGLNEASQIKSLKETKREKLAELDKIQTLQRELTTGRLPF